MPNRIFGIVDVVIELRVFSVDVVMGNVVASRMAVITFASSVVAVVSIVVLHRPLHQ